MLRARTLRRILMSLGLTALGACSDGGPDAAREVVVQFCAAVAAGKTDAARALLTAGERGQPALRLDQDGLRAGYEVGPARGDRNRVLVDVTTKVGPGPVTFVVVTEEGGWRIALEQSTKATLGGKLEQVRRVIDQAGKQMVERFEQTRREAQQPATPR